MDVRLEDQERINSFSRLNARVQDLRAQLKARRRAVEDYEEASNEVMLLDDEEIPFVIGDCMVHLEQEEVERRLETRELQSKIFPDWEVQKETQEEIERLEGEIRTIEEEMAELKKILYGRFGNAINLEE